MLDRDTIQPILCPMIGSHLVVKVEGLLVASCHVCRTSSGSSGSTFHVIQFGGALWSTHFDLDDLHHGIVMETMIIFLEKHLFVPLLAVGTNRNQHHIVNIQLLLQRFQHRNVKNRLFQNGFSIAG